MVLTSTQCTEVENGKEEVIIGKAVQCVLDIMPPRLLDGAHLLTDNYMMNILSQWDPLNPRDYLRWPVFDGPEAWAATCHFSGTIKQCFEPMIEAGIKLVVPKNVSLSNDIIVPALYFITLCEHQAILTDPRTNNAECVHQRMLSDDVLRCQGVLGWQRGNQFLIANVNYPKKYDKWLSDLPSSIYECIYNRGNWRHACGSDVEAMMRNLTKSFSNLIILNPETAFFTVSQYFMCDPCKPGSDLTIYDKLNNLRDSIVSLLIKQNQSPYLFRQCKLVNYPLNQCHLRLIWRRDVYAMFCHQVRNVIIPEFTPHLPLCDFGKYLRSAIRICKMGYGRFMDTASHIARCTKDEDELFPCYKGVYLDPLTWGLVSAGHVWKRGTGIDGSRLRTVYSQIKTCIPRLYDHLRHTCRHGPPVVQLIQDLRVVLMIDAPTIFSTGTLWHFCHLDYKKRRIHVNHC